MRSLITILNFLLILLLCGTSFSQIDVRIELLNPNIEIFFLTDFDINSPATGPVIFQIILTNSYSDTTVQLFFVLETQSFGELSNGSTELFPLAPGITTITNRDLFSNSGDFQLTDYQVNSEAEDFLASILATGKLPSDTYVFRVEVTGAPKPDPIKLVITNPNTVDLVAPGYAAGRGIEDCQESFTALPQFQWESDMKRYRIIIAEARADEDPESLLIPDTQSNFVRDFILADAVGEFDFSFDPTTIPSTSFQYPASGTILILRPGRTYYWRIIAFTATSMGLLETESEIFCFRIADLEGSQPRSSEDAVLINLLLSLGINKEDLFGESGPLAGYHYSDPGIYFNENRITLVELIRKINELRSKFSGNWDVADQ